MATTGRPTLLNLGACAAVAVGAAFAVPVLMRYIRRWTVRPRLVVLNPQDGSVYNKMLMQMLEEMFAAIGSRATLVELDIIAKGSAAYSLPKLDSFDGVIIPGSRASACACRVLFIFYS